MQILYFLVGPKRSGKTFIGSYLHQHTAIHFLRVESIWLSLKDGEDGWQKVIEAIEHCFITHKKVMIENLGAGEGFMRFYSSLKKQYETRTIQVKAELPLCFKRLKERNNADHIPASDDKVQEYNIIASQVELDWDIVVENNGTQPVEEIAEMIMSI